MNPNIQCIISIIRFIIFLILFVDTIGFIFITPNLIELLTDLECGLQNIYDTYNNTILTDTQQIKPHTTCCYRSIFVVLPSANRDTYDILLSPSTSPYRLISYY